MYYLIRLVLAVMAGLVMVAAWDIDIAKIGFPAFMLGWVVAVTILTDIDAIVRRHFGA